MHMQHVHEMLNTGTFTVYRNQVLSNVSEDPQLFKNIPNVEGDECLWYRTMKLNLPIETQSFLSYVFLKNNMILQGVWSGWCLKFRLFQNMVSILFHKNEGHYMPRIPAFLSGVDKTKCWHRSFEAIWTFMVGREV